MADVSKITGAFPQLGEDYNSWGQKNNTLWSQAKDHATDVADLINSGRLSASGVAKMVGDAVQAEAGSVEAGGITDSFLASKILDAGSLSAKALGVALAPAYMADVYAGWDLITYGHSFLAEQGLSDVSDHWARRFASAFGLTYPTSSGGTANDLKRAVGGSEVFDTARRVLATAPYVPGSRQFVIVEALINTARLHGGIEPDLTAARNAMRAILVGLNASQKIEESDAAITYSAGSWATGDSMSGSQGRYNGADGAYFQFTAPTEDAYVLTLGRGAGVAGAQIRITDETTGSTLANLDLSGQSLGSYGPYAWRVPTASRGHVIRFTKTGGTSMYFDALIPQRTTPPPVLWMKEPWLGDYSYSTQFPNGSDTALNAFNALVDTIAGEFANVIVANPNRAGYWQKSKALPGVADSLVQSDGVHPSALGGLALFRTARDGLFAYMMRRAIQVNQ